MANIERIAIIGLDSAEPTLALERWLDDLPTLRSLVRTGRYGRLRSCVPPTTIPAWSCMASGKDPGQLGVYGFQDRRDWTYENPGLSTNLEIRQPRLWDLVGRGGHPSIIVGVPQTFPIVRPPRGCMLTGLLTPGADSPHAYPPELGDELRRLVGPIRFDVERFRTADKPALLEQLHELTRQRFAIARHLITTRPWSLLWMVDLGLDRLHHGFWQFMDPEHRRHPPDSPMVDAIHDFYVFVDARLGELLEEVDRETTAVWVVSDHGAKRLDGGFCINDWLIEQQWLTLKTPVRGARRLELADVDWSRTKAWGEGGYCGRIYVNRVGREPRGTVAEDEYEQFCEELVARLEHLTGPDGEMIESMVVRPAEEYAELNGVPPDLILLVGDLHWRCVGRVGNEGWFVEELDVGPDGANHAPDGLHILSHGSLDSRRQDASLYDVVPTALDLLGLSKPRGLVGRSLCSG